MRKMFLFATLLFAYTSNLFAQNVTTAGNGLYKPTTTSLALSDGSAALTSSVVFDYGVSAATLEVKKSSASYLFVNNTGSVGIGQASPTSRLHIKSGSSSSSNGAFYVENSASTGLFKIRDDGSVAIGNTGTVTGMKLSVSGNSSFGGNTYHNGTAYFDDGSGASLYLGNGYIVSGNEEGLYDGNGDITIAVWDYVDAKAYYGPNGLLTLQNDPITFLPTAKIGGQYGPSQDCRLDVNGSIFCNKKVFIGTADGTTSTKIASYALAVNGDAIFNKVKVKLYGVWPDYVFEDNYTLKPLHEVEQYIKKYKHLPGLASAEELNKQESIDIGETQATLLKKIEELTLYLIDINKKVEILMEENKILKAKNK